jgi:hypothetical protein
MRELITLSVLATSLFAACRPGEDATINPGGGYSTLTVGGLMDSVVYLPGGDSVEVQGVGEIAAPREAPGSS